MLECGLRAVVLHNKEVVWNYYAEFTADCRRINTNVSKKADSSQIPTTMAWAKITGKPSTYAPSSHTHDDRYYTESEINTKISKRLRFTWADDATGLVISIDGQKFRIPQANMSKYTSNYDS